MHILVVDDEPPVTALCVKTLRRLGYEVEGATSGEEALSRLAAAPVDLPVVDYRLPGQSGFEVIQHARILHPGLKVVLITGHGTRQVVGEATDLGVNGILLKPFTSPPRFGPLSSRSRVRSFEIPTFPSCHGRRRPTRRSEPSSSSLFSRSAASQGCSRPTRRGGAIPCG